MRPSSHDRVGRVSGSVVSALAAAGILSALTWRTPSFPAVAAGNAVAWSLLALAGLLARGERRQREDRQSQLQLETAENKAKIRAQTEMLDQVRDAILICDMNDQIIYWNRGASRLYGVSQTEALGRNAGELLFRHQPDSWRTGREAVLSRGSYHIEASHLDALGHGLVVEHRRTLIRDEEGRPAAQLVINYDVTDKKKEDARDRRSQRLESIGTLAGGIAHDLNNVLTPILMSAKLLKPENAAPRNAQLIATIVASAERGGQMISKLLAFAGGEQGVRARERIDLSAIAKETEDILRHTLPKTIELRVRCEDGLPPVRGDATELSQVLINLAINSRDAMPDGGRLDLRVERFEVDASRADHSGGLHPGPHVLLTVSDTGSGIAPEIVDRIFDPFFTTKQQGKGTGLGLATSLGIVRGHGGDICVYSEPGVGTTFMIYLPSTNIMDAKSSADVPDEVAAGNGESVLLVDDEPLILEAAHGALEAAGYRVISVSGGAQALAIYQYQWRSIDLVLLDMMMPGIDGFATKEGLRAINPSVRIVASSGLRRPGAEGGRLLDVDGFLPKPYSSDQLLRIVHRVLLKPTATAPRSESAP